MRSLHRRHGFGVSPRAYDSAKSAMTSSREALGQIPYVERDSEHIGRPAGISRVVQRAAAAGTLAGVAGLSREGEMHADDLVPGVARRAAATAESTPPLIAASTRIELVGSAALRAGQRPGERAGATRTLGARADHVEQRGDVGAGRGVAQREAQRATRVLGVGLHRQQHVRRPRDPGRAGRPGRALHALGVQQHQQRIALAAGERQVRVARQPASGRAQRCPVEHDVRHPLAYSSNELVAQRGRPGRRAPAARPPRPGRRPRSRRLRARRACPTGPPAPGRRRASAGSSRSRA